MQSTFLNAHRALQRGVRPEAELAWLFKIAHNVCLTRRRSSRRRGRVEAPSDLAAVQDLLPAPSREPAEELIRLPDALADMPVNQRRAILLREWKGLSYREIGTELRLSQSAVETLIFRARRTLASNLEVEPERTGLLARVRQAFDASALVAALKALLSGGAAMKATAAAVAVSGAVVVAATAPSPPPAAKKKPAAQVNERTSSERGSAPAPTGSRATLSADQRPADAKTKPRAAVADEAVATEAAPAAGRGASDPSRAQKPAAEQTKASPAIPQRVKQPHPLQANGAAEPKPEKSAKENGKKPEATPPPAPPLEAPEAVAPPTEPLPADESQGGGPPEDKVHGPKK